MLDRRNVTFAMMWLAALAAMIVLYLTQEARQRDDRLRSDRAPVLTPDDRAAARTLRAPGGSPQIAPPPLSDGPPRQLRHDARHTGRSPYRGPSSAALAWRVQTGDHVTAQAVIGQDGTIYIGSHDGHLYAIAPDGSVRWRTDLSGPIYTTAALAEGRLYVGSDADLLTALDARDGRILWQLDTEDDADAGIAIAPDGALVFGAGPDVFAVDPEDGEVRFRFRTGLKVFSPPAIGPDGSIYFGSQDDHLYALAPDGRMRWRFRARDDIDGSPALGDDGTIYFGSDDRHVYALRPDGTVRWSSEVGGAVRAPLALGLDGSVIAAVFRPRPRIVALDGATGAERWELSVEANASVQGMRSGPIVDRDGNVYFGADDDNVYSLGPDGRLRWFYPTSANVDGEPVLTPEGLLIVGTDDHYVYALGAR